DRQQEDRARPRPKKAREWPVIHSRKVRGGDFASPFRKQTVLLPVVLRIARRLCFRAGSSQIIPAVCRQSPLCGDTPLLRAPERLILSENRESRLDLQCAVWRQKKERDRIAVHRRDDRGNAASCWLSQSRDERSESCP